MKLRLKAVDDDQPNANKMKHSLLWVPWILARLWMGFSPSRLIMAYLRPRPVHERIPDRLARLGPAKWFQAGKFFYCIKMYEKSDECIIRRLPMIEPN